MNKKENYAIVFDMDETLGSFSQLYKFWNLTKLFLKNDDLPNKYFFNIIDLFPDFLRPQLLRLLKNIKNKKNLNICNYAMIYTNNNGPNEWANIIKEYLHYKLNFKLFDKIIRAFKIDGKQIEIGRTSHNKSYRDFINCTKLPTNTKVCFLDDVYHEEMVNDNVLYINIEPYHHNENYSYMCERFYKKNRNLFNTSLREYQYFIHLNTSNHNLNALNKPNRQKNIEYLFTNHIINEINKFFKTREKHTKKNKYKKNNKKTHKL
tara:strand:+ start:7693 stop:8481 length:789 start_codon:yes stop_codon:yes gene_type:complete